MTENEAIEVLSNELMVITDMIGYCKEFEKESNLALAYRVKRKDAHNMAIAALKEIQLYNDGKLCLIPKDVYSRQCSELDAYKEIGTVEECREAVDKQKPKKPVLRNDNGKLRKSCPVCGCFFSPLSRSCPKCGQAIRLGENKEGMRDE